MRATPRIPPATLCLLAALAAACGTQPDVTEPSPPAPGIAVSADLLNGSLSLLDLDRLLAAGGTLADATIERVDVSSAEGQGPLTLALVGDGDRAVVLRSPGVLSFVGARLGLEPDTLPSGGAGILVVDLEARQILAEIATAGPPIQLALDRPRDRVFVSVFSGGGEDGSVGSLVVVDPATLEAVAEVPVAPFLEGLSINDAGTRGAAIGAAAGLYLFDPADPAATLSATPLRLSDDSSGVTFVSGTDLVVVANSRNPANWVVVDASDLTRPVVVDEGAPLDGYVPYMVGAVPGRPEVVLPVSDFASLRLLHLDVSQVPPAVLHDVVVPDVRAFPQAVTVDPEGRHAFIGVAAARELIVLDLASGSVRRLPWLDRPGPTALVVVQ